MKKSIPLIFILSISLQACNSQTSTSQDQPQQTNQKQPQTEQLSSPQSITETSAQPTTALPDIDREKRLTSEIQNTIMDGEPINLKAGDLEFLAIDMAAETDTPKGAVILLHGRGFHPNWPDTIYPVRTALPAHGYRTLSIQLPVLEKTAKYYDYVPLFPAARKRIDVAIQHLKSEGIENIILFAHSCGAHMAMSWITKHGDSAIQAYIGAGMGATDYKQPMQSPFPLDKMQVPVLDIYGSNEYPAVIKMAAERLTAIQKAGNPKSAQKVVPDADHYFADAGENLVKAVAKWLATLE